MWAALWFLREAEKRQRELDRASGYVPPLPPMWLAWGFLAVAVCFFGAVVYTIITRDLPIIYGAH
jgi:hypothetical protein